MKKMMAIVATAGVITALSVSAFASEVRNTPNSNTPAPAATEIGAGVDAFADVKDKSGSGEAEYTGVLLVENGGEYVATIGEGLDPMATVADKNLDNEDPEHSDVLLVENGGEYNAEIGEGLSRTDMRKDSVDNLFAPAQQ